MKYTIHFNHLFLFKGLDLTYLGSSNYHRDSFSFNSIFVFLCLEYNMCTTNEPQEYKTLDVNYNFLAIMV